MKNTQFTTHDVKNCCGNESKLNIEFNTSGKEYNGWFIKEQKKICRITVPKGRKSIGKGLYHSMARQLNLTNSEFDDLLECPLKRAGYEEILKKRGIIKDNKQ